MYYKPSFVFLVRSPKHRPDFYYEYFKDNNIKHVVRLNGRSTYNAKNTFVNVAHIKHTDLGFCDGTPPPFYELNKFMCICEEYANHDFEVIRTNNKMSESNTNSISEINLSKRCAVAVHCKGKC